MVNLEELPTPVAVVDLEKLKANIERASQKAKKHNKKLWPMVKTHKSSYIANLQKKHGSNGFVCGSITEAEVLANNGSNETFMFGYPVAGKENFSRVAKLLDENRKLIFRVDCEENARFLNNQLQNKDLTGKYTVIVDVGYHRHGVKPSHVGNFVHNLEELNHLTFQGIVAHPGHAYDSKNSKEVRQIAKEAAKKMKTAVKSLATHQYTPQIVGIGSTPTFRFDIKKDVYTHLFPGTYVYYDRQQATIYGSTSLDNCAFHVLATVISHPTHSGGSLAITNAGSTYFDKQPIDDLYGYGQLKRDPELVISDVSQEVSKLDLHENSNIQLGEKVRILPNHVCPVNNGVDFFIGYKNQKVKKLIKVNGRSGGRVKSKLLASFL